MENQSVTLIPLSAFEQFAQRVISNEIAKALATLKIEKEDKLLSRSELAEILGVTKTTITTYKNEGMPYRMVKRRPYFLFSEVEKFMNLKNRKTKKG